MPRNERGFALEPVLYIDAGNSVECTTTMYNNIMRLKAEPFFRAIKQSIIIDCVHSPKTRCPSWHFLRKSNPQKLGLDRYDMI